MAGGVDDLGFPFDRQRRATRVVSLVPSLTEALASASPEAVVGATVWCTHPADLDVVRVRGTKNPDVAAIIDLQPDVVVANKEENRRVDVERLRASHIPVWVTDIRTVPQAIASMQSLFTALGWVHPAWLGEAAEAWAGPVRPVSRRVAVAVWRDPWMVVGSDTFTGDLIRRLGWENVYATSPDRYPKVSVDALDTAELDVVLLPDEPYPFSADDGPEAFRRVATELLSGRLLTWYGPSLIDAAKLSD